MTVQSKYKRTSKEYQAMQAKKAELGVPPAVDFWTPVKDLEEKDTYKEAKHTYATISIPLILDGQSQEGRHSYDRHIKLFN